MVCSTWRIRFFRRFPKNLVTVSRFIIIFLLYALLSACTLNSTTNSPAVSIPDSDLSQIDDGITPFPELWTGETAVMRGICFESAFDASGQVFVIRNDSELINFFNLADNSRLCRRPIARYGFNFDEGRILAGLWSYGFGCTARHEFIDLTRDDEARILTINLRFVTEGTCNYELVRPFWIGLEGVADYEIIMTVS